MEVKKKGNPLLRIFIDSRQQWIGLSAIVIFTLLAGVFKSVSAILWGKVVDLGVANQIDTMIIMILIMLLFVFLDAVRTAIHYRLIGCTIEKMFFKFRMRAFSIITDGDVSVLEKNMRSGDVAMRVNSDTDQLCDIISGNFPHLGRLVFQAIIAIICCIFINIQLSVAYFILLPISVWLTKKISEPIQKQRKTALDSTGDAMNLASEILNGSITVKSFNIQNKMNQKFGKAIDLTYDETVKTEKIGIKLTVIKYAVSVIQMMTLFLVGSILVSKGMATIGNVMSFVALSFYVSEAFGMIDSITRMLRNSLALSQRLYEIYDIPIEQSGSASQLSFHNEYIHMKDVSFSYNDGITLLKGINLSLAENKKIALIGPSGCGKSTLLKLICKFYNPIDGELSLFGTQTENCDLKSLRKELALVTQDACLFDGSIYENVLYGRIDATQNEVMSAIKDANLLDFVSKLPQGVHSQVGEYGGQLSGGQRQRVCIARALLKNARLVLLDEATSALDTQTESEIQKALDKLLVGRSAIIVAHRLSTIQNVDYIYCLEDGKITEEGPPKELLASRGYYYNMCIQQGLVTAEGRLIG